MRRMVYIEVFILDNLLMDSLIIRLGAAMLRRRIRFLRTILSALLCTAYSLLALIFPLLSGITFKIISSALICAAAYMQRDSARRMASNFLKELIMFYLATMLVGGLSFAVLYMSGASWGSVTMPLRAALIAAFIAIWLPRLVRVRAKARAQKLLELNVEFEANVRIKALIDSGNALIEPVSGLPVVVVSPGILSVPERGMPVAYSSVAGDGIIYAHRPRRISAYIDKRWREFDALVGVSSTPIIGADALIGTFVFENV